MGATILSLHLRVQKHRVTRIHWSVLVKAIQVQLRILAVLRPDRDFPTRLKTLAQVILADISLKRLLEFRIICYLLPLHCWVFVILCRSSILEFGRTLSCWIVRLLLRFTLGLSGWSGFIVRRSLSRGLSWDCGKITLVVWTPGFHRRARCSRPWDRLVGTDIGGYHCLYYQINLFFFYHI